MNICTAQNGDIPFILDLYERAFPKNERKPFSLIERKAALGEMEILVFTDGRRRVGFGITALGENLVLLDYFAIEDNYRSRGYGSDALELLQALYSDRRMFLEIEKPVCPEKKEIRQRRKDFYLRNGMQETGIDVELFGVHMELLSSLPNLIYEDCERLYRSLIGPMFDTYVRRV